MTHYVDATDRSYPVQHLTQFFDHEHLRDGRLQAISRECAELAAYMLEVIPDNPELTAGLRKLLEAKDCFVRAAIAGSDEG